MAGPLRGWGGGLKGRAIKDKKNFFWNLFFQRSKISTAIKLKVGRGSGLNGQPYREELFFVASLIKESKIRIIVP